MTIDIVSRTGFNVNKAALFYLKKSWDEILGI